MKNLNLEEKDIYKLFNEVKLEEVDLFENSNEVVSDIQKTRMKKKLRKSMKEKKSFKGLKSGVMAASIGAFCLVGVSIKYPAFAQNIPILNSIIESLNSRNGDHAKYSDYSNILNKSVTSNNITFTINEVLADESKLIISYTIKSPNKINDLEVFGINHFLKLNGKNFSSGGSSTGKYVDNTTYIGSTDINADAIKEAKNLNIDLNIDKIGNISGKWSFAFSLSKNEVLKNKLVINPNVKLSHKDRVTNIDKISISPLQTSISISGVYNKDTDTNNPLLPSEEFIVFDDRGVELNYKGGRSKSDENGNHEFLGENEFANLSYKPKALTIIPYIVTPRECGSSDSNGKTTVIKGIIPKEVSTDVNNSYPIELSQGKLGKLIITEIIKEANKTLVKYKAEGIAPLFQGHNLHIKNSDEEDIKTLDYDIRKDETKPNEFVKTFEALDPSKKYVIYTDNFDNVDVREDLKFTVDLTK